MQESFVSFLGLVSLLVLAWVISYHREKVRFPPIVMGTGLQFLLALTIIRDGTVSYVGMTLLGVVIVSYMLRHVRIVGGFWDRVLIAVGAVVAGALPLAFQPLGWLADELVAGVFFLLALAALLVNGLLIKRESAQGWAGAAFLTGAISYCVAAGRSGQRMFQMFSDKVEDLLALSNYGAEFLFGNLAKEEYFFAGNDFFPGFGFLFAFKVLPTIIFFGALMSVLYYLGVVQIVVQAMGRFMRWSLGTSGAESLSCSANVFVGQTEAPLLIKPFLGDMTRSELLTIMVGGFATIAGGVLAGYISMGVDAGHLIAASVMSAPAALVVGKIICPETEESKTAGNVEMPKINTADNLLEAATSGITDGLKLAVNVGAMLLGFISLIALVDVMLNWADGMIDGRLMGGDYFEYAVTGFSPVAGEYTGFFPGSLQTLFGFVLRPLAWLLGVPWEDAGLVANLLGIKLTLNEFVAFGSLGGYINDSVMSPRAEIIATYALCGFANFASIGIQLGGIGALAPERRKDLSKVVLKAMFGGAFASWTTACIAGILL